MVTGYFDESGIHDSAIVTTIGGFISTAEGWDKFNRDWLAVLNEFDISCFHMKHFAHFLGEFAKFKDNEGRRRELLSKL